MGMAKRKGREAKGEEKRGKKEPEGGMRKSVTESKSVLSGPLVQSSAMLLSRAEELVGSYSEEEAVRRISRRLHHFKTL